MHICFLHDPQDAKCLEKGRKHIEALVGRWRRPQVMQWLRFHHLEQYSEAFANVTGQVRSSRWC